MYLSVVLIISSRHCLLCFHSCDLYKSGEDGFVLPREQFYEFQGNRLTWNGFCKEVENRELSRFQAAMSVVSTFQQNTMGAMELFKQEVMDMNFKADEADIILTTCHAAKGMEWDNVQVCEDLFDLARVTNGGPLTKVSENNNQRRQTWEFAAKNYGDDINLLYVACTRAKKLLSIPSSIKTLLQDFDVLHQTLRMRTLFKESDVTKESGISILGMTVTLSVFDALNLYKDLVIPLRQQFNLRTADRLVKLVGKEEFDEAKALPGDSEFESYFGIASKLKSPPPAVASNEASPAKKPKLARIFYVIKEAAAVTVPAGTSRPYDKKDKAPTGRAKCRDCGELIAEGTSRVGVQVYKPDKKEFWPSYFHNNSKCCPKDALMLLRFDPNPPKKTTKKSAYSNCGYKKGGYKKGGSQGYKRSWKGNRKRWY